MLTIKSKADPDLRYLFESEDTPVTVEKLAQDIPLRTQDTIEATLTLSRSHPPFDQEEYDAWNGIMKDCAHPYLKGAYDDSYDAVMRFLKNNGVNGEPYRIHHIRTRE